MPVNSSAGDRLRRDAAARTRRAARVAAEVAGSVSTTIQRSSGPWCTKLDGVVQEHIEQTPSVAHLAWWINDAFRCLTASIQDASYATSVLMKEGLKTQLSALASARICLESTGVLTYLLECQSDLLERVLLLLWHDINEEVPMIEWAEERNLGVGRKSLSEEVEELTTVLGWTIARDRRGRFRNLLDPETGEKVLLPNATSLVRHLDIVNSEQGWRITSAASHGRPWLLSHEIAQPDAPVPAATLTAANITISAVTVSARIVGMTLESPILLREAEKLAGTEMGPPPFRI